MAHVVAPLIELTGTLVIAGSVLAAVVALLEGGGFELARYRVADGVVTALGLELASTMLKTVVLHTWPQLAAFAVVFAIRTLLGRLFRAERVREQKNRASLRA